MLEVLREATRIGHLDHSRQDWVNAVLANPARACVTCRVTPAAARLPSMETPALGLRRRMLGASSLRAISARSPRPRAITTARPRSG